MKMLGSQLIKNLFKASGYRLTKLPTYKGKTEFNLGELHYGTVYPYANYTPWAGDSTFLPFFEMVKANTMVDIYRCYELWQLVSKANALNPNAAYLEVGVWRGGTSAIIAKRLSLLDSKSKIYIADTFEGVAKVTDKDTFYSGGEHNDTNQSIVENLFRDIVQYPSHVILKGIFPDATGALIPDNERFALCHIDVDVYASAKGVVDWIWQKLEIGGMIIFDDYGFHTCDGVTNYVESLRNLSDRIVIHNLNGHAIIIKLN